MDHRRLLLGHMSHQYLRELAPDGQVLVDIRSASRAMKRSNWTRYIIAARSSPRSSADHQPNLTEVPPASPARVIDFFEVRHRLRADSERIAQKSGMDRQIKEPAMRREPAKELADAFQETYYWLIWAVVLVGLALGIFGL